MCKAKGGKFVQATIGIVQSGHCWVQADMDQGVNSGLRKRLLKKQSALKNPRPVEVEEPEPAEEEAEPVSGLGPIATAAEVAAAHKKADGWDTFADDLFADDNEEVFMSNGA